MHIQHLSTCSTCQRILNVIPDLKHFALQDIKTKPITAKQLEELKKTVGSYEALTCKASTNVTWWKSILKSL
ncbi:MAG: hypothetical protein KA408_04545 [Flavobacteriales bacterium]|nr:hypothetical protein [Flavobacteriales bacterium]